MASQFRGDVQGLRAIAVLLVIVYHAGARWLPGGFVGVDVFFVISGFLITGILAREFADTGSISLTSFFAKRFRRLLPAALVVVAASTIAAWVTYSPLSLKQYASSALATTIYVSNVWFAHLSTDYLAEGADSSPLLHTWSLGVEEQFYALWPLLFLFAGTRLRLSLVTIGVVSLVACIALTNYSEPWAFFSMPTRAWEFAVGGLIALSARQLPAAAAPIGLGIIMTAALAFDRSVAFPGFAALVPVLGAGLIIAANSPMLSAKPLRWIGDRSYSLYLWHWPLLIFVKPSGVVETTVTIASIALLSIATYSFVEDPMRRQRWPSLLTITAAASASSVAALSLLGVRAVAATNLNTPEQRRFAEAAADIPRIYREGCHVPIPAVTPQECVYGDPHGQKTVVLFGDSHAAHWFPAAERLSIERSWRLVSLTKSGCPSFVIEPHSEELGRGYTECTVWRERAFARIDEIRPDIVIATNLYSVNSKDEWERAAEAMLARLDTNVIVLRGVPRPVMSAPECLSRAAWKDETAERCIAHAAAPDALAAEISAASRHSRARVVDLTDAVCQGNPCLVYTGDIVKYFDSHHMASRFSASLWVELGSAIDLAIEPIKVARK